MLVAVVLTTVGAVLAIAQSAGSDAWAWLLVAPCLGMATIGVVAMVRTKPLQLRVEGAAREHVARFGDRGMRLALQAHHAPAGQLAAWVAEKLLGLHPLLAGLVEHLASAAAESIGRYESAAEQESAQRVATGWAALLKQRRAARWAKLTVLGAMGATLVLVDVGVLPVRLGEEPHESMREPDALQAEAPPRENRCDDDRRCSELSRQVEAFAAKAHLTRRDRGAVKKLAGEIDELENEACVGEATTLCRDVEELARRAANMVRGKHHHATRRPPPESKAASAPASRDLNDAIVEEYLDSLDSPGEDGGVDPSSGDSDRDALMKPPGMRSPRDVLCEREPDDVRCLLEP